MSTPKSSEIINSSDSERITELFNETIADIAVEQPEVLNLIIQKSGVPVESNNLNPKYLAEILYNNIHTNDALLKEASLLVAKKQTKSTRLYAGGADPISAIAGAVGEVATAAGVITTAATAKKTEAEKNKGKVLDLITAKQSVKAEADKALASVKSAALNHKTLITVSGIFGIILLLGIGAYVFLGEEKLSTETH